MATKKLSEIEIGKRILGLRPGGSFTVSTSTERGTASTLIRAFKMVGKLNHEIASRKTESGEYAFYIVPQLRD